MERNLIRRVVAFCTIALALSVAAYPERIIAGGLIGDAYKWVGARTGLKPIVAIGQSMDNANKALKQAVQPYGQLEDASTAVVRREVLAICETAFDIVTKPVEVNCSNSSSRMENRQDIRNAESTLQKIGLFSPQDFAGVAIRACETPMAEGLTPDANTIFLRPDSFNHGPVWLGELLAHEMTHVRQYSRSGSGQFKCGYTQAFIGCFGCQNKDNAFEREAYAVQAQAEAALIRYYGAESTPPPEIQSMSIDENASHAGHVTISNATQVPQLIWLESQSSKGNFTLMPNQFQTFAADPQDAGFNIQVSTLLDGGTHNLRSYGIAAGGVYSVIKTSAGLFDIAVNGDGNLIAADGQDSTSTILGIRYAEASNGVIVESVDSNSLAAQLQIKPGDVFLAVQGIRPSKATLDDQLNQASDDLIKIVGNRGQTRKEWNISHTTEPDDETPITTQVPSRNKTRTDQAGCTIFEDGTKACTERVNGGALVP